jgi:hypothetical protein
MQARVRIGAEDLSRLQHESLFHLHKLMKAGIISLAPLTLTLPLCPLHTYLHLHSHIQNTHSPLAQTIDFIDELVTKRESLLDPSNANNEDSPNLLPP